MYYIWFRGLYALYKPAKKEVCKYITREPKARYLFKMSELAGLYNAYTLMNHDIYDITNNRDSYMLDFSPPF